MTHPRHSTPQSGGISKIWKFFLRSEGFVPHIRSCKGETSPQNTWLWKPVQIIFRKTITGGNGEATLKGLTYRLTGPGTQHKNTSLKNSYTSVKETHLLILKCLSERQETVGTLSRNVDTGEAFLRTHSSLLMLMLAGAILDFSL